MDPNEIVVALLEAIAVQLGEAREAIYDAGRELADQIWAALQASGEQPVVVLPDPIGGGALGAIWQAAVSPLAQAMADGLEAKVNALVVAPAKRMALTAGLAGVAGGWLARGAMT